MAISLELSVLLLAAVSQAHQAGAAGVTG